MVKADGLMVEIHPQPSAALSDAEQALDFPSFNKMMDETKEILPILNKELSSYEL